MRKTVKYKGVLIDDGDPIIMPPLSVGQMEQLAGKLQEHDAINITEGGFIGGAKRLILRSEIIAEAVRRNYPDFSNEDAKDLVTGENSERLLNIALGTDRTSPKVRTVGEESPAEDAKPTQ